MLKTVLSFGLVAGLLAGVPLFALVVVYKGPPPAHGMLIGYLIMLVALSLVFVAIKRRRDAYAIYWIAALAVCVLGLAISLVAGIVYAAAWEAALAVAKLDFGTEWARIQIEHGKAKGLSEAELARLAAEMDQFKAMYAQPLYRFLMTFAEIFPVGLLVSLVSAALLRNPRFLARRT